MPDPIFAREREEEGDAEEAPECEGDTRRGAGCEEEEDPWYQRAYDWVAGQIGDIIDSLGDWVRDWLGEHDPGRSGQGDPRVYDNRTSYEDCDERIDVRCNPVPPAEREPDNCPVGGLGGGIEGIPADVDNLEWYIGRDGTRVPPPTGTFISWTFCTN